MKTFDNFKDYHFPDGYPRWIQESINNSVDFFIDTTKKRFDISEIKTIFDVGSLNGIESVHFAEKIPNCNIYTFEPNPISFNNVKSNTIEFSNITVYELAASDFNGKSKFYNTIPGGNQGGSSLLKPKQDAPFGKQVSRWNEIEVDTVRLDDWAKLKNIDSVDMLWMDVQGNELNTFFGLGNLLNTVKSIYVEVSTIPYYENGVHKSEVIDYLSKFNLEPVSETYHDQYEGDILFLRKI